jgi:hypothetical protein
VLKIKQKRRKKRGHVCTSSTGTGDMAWRAGALGRADGRAKVEGSLFTTNLLNLFSFKQMK